jgi:molybdenum cofactor biosynthesis protein B
MENDETGKLAMSILESEGHIVKAHVIIPNDPAIIKDTVKLFILNKGIDVIITSGGTGISSKDYTVDTVTGLLQRELVGFGELFRRLSYYEIGVPSIFSRAKMGTAGGKIVVCLPGSKGAMRTALKEILLPALGHLLWEVNR